VKRRRQSPESRPKGRTTRAKYDCLDVLTGDEAHKVLNELLSSRPELISDARRAANALLATVSFGDVAAHVFGALQALDLDDLDEGPRPGGYVEPSEAAWNAIERVVTPYFRDLERRVKLRHEDEALDVCKGIVLGLYRAEHRSFELLANMQRTAHRNLPAARWTSAAADAASGHSRATSSRSTRLTGHGSFADQDCLDSIQSNGH
jgi:hypothetical protein